MSPATPTTGRGADAVDRDEPQTRDRHRQRRGQLVRGDGGLDVLDVLAVHLVRLTALEFVGPRFTDHLDQQVNRHESAPQAGADLDPDKRLQLFDPRRQDRKVGHLHPLEELAMALAVLVEEAGDRRPEEEEHLVALVRRSGQVHEVAGEQAVRVALLPGRARLAKTAESPPMEAAARGLHGPRPAARPSRRTHGRRSRG